MDDSSFDASAMAPILETSRRRLLSGLVGGTLAGVCGWHATGADRKRQSKRHDKNRKRLRNQGGDTRRGKGLSKAEDGSKQQGSAAALKVLTRNLYLGADLAPTFTVQNVQDLIAADTKVFAMVQATNFPERAKALADEIAGIDPHIVGLQEATLWRSEFPPDLSLTPNAEKVEYDFLAILLSELAARGKSYAAIAPVQNFDAEAPRFLSPKVLQDIRITDRDVILRRTDLPENVFSVTNPQSGNFAAMQIIRLLGAEILVLRGWTAVDVTLHGATVRVVETHLEPDNVPIQELQGAELVRGPLATALPTVLLGDLNSPADGGSTYHTMLDAGFVDAWTATRGNDAGFTWGHAEDLRNPEPTLTKRIDFVLTRGGITASSTNRVGHEVEDRTPSGLWPSDHAGVWAVLHVKDE